MATTAKTVITARYSLLSLISLFSLSEHDMFIARRSSNVVQHNSGLEDLVYGRICIYRNFFGECWRAEGASRCNCMCCAWRVCEDFCHDDMREQMLGAEGAMVH
jgi:hypothetical protein